MASKLGASRNGSESRQSNRIGNLLEMQIDNHALRSYDSIAHELGITRRAVILTEARALGKLRKAFARWGVYRLKDGRDSVLEGTSSRLVLMACVCSLAILG
jgi:hypothetical protein